jgi:OmpA-OmpF porin, OOP family
MHFRKFMGACVLAGVLLPAAAEAEDPGFYVGASIGQASQEFSGFDANDTAFKLFGGWSFNKYLAVEGGYIDGGTQSDTISQLDVDISSDGFFVEGLAKWPLGKYVAPYAKLGYVFYDSTTKLSINNQSASESESDSDFIYGGGLEFKLGENFRLRAEYEEVNLPESAFDIFSLAATWQF